MKKGILKDVLIVGLLIVGVYFIIQFADPVRNTITGFVGKTSGSVKGASTTRGAEVTNSLKDDLHQQFENIKKQSMNVKIGDIVGGVSRTRKIVHDIGALKNYTQAQIRKILSEK